jgi:hypothetical protein
MPDDGSSGDLMQQVRTYLAQVYQGVQPSTTSTAPAANGPVLAFEPIGMPVSPADFRLNQSDPSSPLLASVAVERTSQYSNWIPEIDQSETLQINTRTVVGQYTLVLDESQVSDASNADGFAALKASAKKLFGLVRREQSGQLDDSHVFDPSACAAARRRAAIGRSNTVLSATLGDSRHCLSSYCACRSRRYERPRRGEHPRLDGDALERVTGFDAAALRRPVGRAAGD